MWLLISLGRTRVATFTKRQKNRGEGRGVAELLFEYEATSLQAGRGNGARTMDRHQGLKLLSASPNSRQGDPLQLIERITSAKTAIFLAIYSHLHY